jgi:hypothetical protein
MKNVLTSDPFDKDQERLVGDGPSRTCIMWKGICLGMLVECPEILEIMRMMKKMNLMITADVDLVEDPVAGRVEEAYDQTVMV